MVNSWIKKTIFILIIVLYILWGLCFITLREFKALWISLGVFNFLLTLIYVGPYLPAWGQAIRHRRSRRFVLEIVALFLIICILSLVNFIAAKKNFTYDLTSEKINSLSEQSRLWLKRITAPLKITLYASQGDWKSYLSFFKLYEREQSFIKIQAIDPEAEPTLAKSQGINQNGQVVLEYQGKNEKFVLKDELSMLNGIKRLLEKKQRKAYFITGHQELDCLSKDQLGGSGFCQEVHQVFSETSSLNLIAQKNVPPDAAALMMIEPKEDLLAPEILRLQQYLEKGGTLMVAYTPFLSKKVFPQLNGLLSKWGVEYTSALIIDRQSSLNGEASVPIVDQYSSKHPLVRQFAKRTLYPLVSPLKVSQPMYENTVVHDLVFSSDFPGSYAETNMKGLELGQAQFDSQLDIEGPLLMVALAERLNFENDKTQPDTRIAIWGTGLLFTNQYLNQASNLDLTLNILQWLIYEEDLTSLSRPQTKNNPIVLSAMHLHAIFYLAIIVIPLIFGVASLIVYWRRRKC